MKKLILICSALLVIICGSLAAGWYMDNRLPNFREELDFYVLPGDTPQTIADRICESGSVRFPKRLARVLEKGQVATYMKHGHYRVTTECTSIYVARMINNGWQEPVRMTLSGSIRRVGDIAAKVSRNMKVDSLEVAEAITSPKMMAKYGVTPQTAFSLFIPDTYELYWDSSIETILNKMKKASDAFWTPTRLAKARQMGFSRMEVTIIASIVQCESNYTPDYPKLAGVYVNRLRKGMKLQACPTVAFVYDFQLNRVLQKHLKVESPYNTYKYAGLPPGPICSPSKEALDAVLNADTKDGYLFFCASSNFDGTHKFASSYKEHSVNAKAFQAALDKRNSQKKI